MYILHIDFNSYFATVEQQANPRLRGKPIGVTGGDRTERTVIGAASVEAKKFGVKTGMRLGEARRLCPQIILVPGDSDKYLECTKRFLNILKDFSPYVEVFSIDECFIEIPSNVIPAKAGIHLKESRSELDSRVRGNDNMVNIARHIKQRIYSEIGEWITCSIGISYNKLMAKLAGSLQKPDGLVMIPNQEEAIKVLDRVELDSICGIGGRIKSRLNKMGIFNFRQLRQIPLSLLLFEFKSYGQFLYNATRGIDERPVLPFYEKQEVKSIGHRYTLNYDTGDPEKIKQILLKITEMVARRLRAKKLVGKTVSCWFRYQFHLRGEDEFAAEAHLGGVFTGDGMQATIPSTDDGMDLFKAAWKSFQKIWNPSISSLRGDSVEPGQVSKIRMIGASISNLTPKTPQNLSFLEEAHRKEIITNALDKINDRYGEFTLQRGALLQSAHIKRIPNPFLSDRRFKL